MYKNYNLSSLSLNEYLKKNKNAETGFRFCNGMCLKYLPEEKFFEGKGNCKDCYYLFLKVKKLIDNNQTTYEKFRENPSAVIIEKIEIPLNRVCKTCKEELSLEKFEASRKECIKCRRKKKKTNYEEQFKEYIPAIETCKKNIESLKNLFRGMNADLVKLAISHYQITVPHPERKKDIMITYLINHFESLLNPKICLGGCGHELEEEFSVCDECKIKNKPLREEKKVQFEENIDDFIKSIDEFTDEMACKLTKQQCFLITQKLDIKCYVSNKKTVIVEKLKEYFDNKKKKTLNAINNKKDFSGKLIINGIIIESREDGMVNATALCKAGNKRFSNWYQLDSTKELLTVLQDEFLTTGIPVVKIIDIKEGKNGGSWIHPDLAVQLAQWISPSIAIQVSRWIRELVITGTVSLGAEKNEQELLRLQIENKKLQDKCRKFLQKKNYHKFKKGHAFYIISDIDSKSNKCKAGFEGVNINMRLQEHRTSLPGCKLEFLIYSEYAKLVETAVFAKFDFVRIIKNKEWLFNIDYKELIKGTRVILDAINIKYTQEDNIKAYNEQIYLDFDQSYIGEKDNELEEYGIENSDTEEYNEEEDNFIENDDEENILS